MIMLFFVLWTSYRLSFSCRRAFSTRFSVFCGKTIHPTAKVSERW